MKLKIEAITELLTEKHSQIHTHHKTAASTVCICALLCIDTELYLYSTEPTQYSPCQGCTHTELNFP